MSTLRLLSSARRTMSTAVSPFFSSYLVSPESLHAAIRKHQPSKISTAPRIVPLCASWFLPNDSRSGRETFLQARVPKARFFDLDKVCDTTSPYPHMLPTPSVFAKAMSELGITPEDEVVVYDSKESGIFSAPRVAFTFRVFGHQNVHILNNFKLWTEQGLPTESGEPEPAEPTTYPVPTLDKSKVIAFEELKDHVADQGKEGALPVHILDARPTGRWKGTDPEPRPGLSSGHMPSSISIPFNAVLDPETKAFLSPEQLKELFLSKGVQDDKPIISSCGTGVTAVVIDTALELAGYSPERRIVYDGSWTEWAQRVKPGEHLIRKI